MKPGTGEMGEEQVRVVKATSQNAMTHHPQLGVGVMG